MDIVPFKNHTFKVKADSDMEILKESIKENGVMEPIIAFRNEDGQIEQITGHRRVFACQELGILTIPTLIKNVNRDQATILMGSSNLERRTVILPSEKAATYKAMLDALSRQGRRSDILSKETYIHKGRADEELSEIVKESARQIQRYIRLNYLNPELLQLVDEKRIALKPAVELSYLSNATDVEIDSSKVDFQRIIYDYYTEYDITPSHSQALRMHRMYKENLLTEEDVRSILSDKKGNQIAISYKLSGEIISRFFHENDSINDIEQTIVKALSMYMKHEEQLKKETINKYENEVE